jgi:hypothetical protein
MVRRLVPALILAVAVLATGCGGGASQSAYCKALRQQAKDAAAEQKKTTQTSIDAATSKKKLDTAFGKLEAHAPTEIKDDYETLHEYYTLYLNIYTNPQASQADRQKLTASAQKASTAGKAITDYNKKVCKFQTTTTAPRATITTRATATTKS